MIDRGRELPNPMIGRISKLFKERGIEVESISRKISLQVVGESVNDARQFEVTTKEGKKIPIFVKFFPQNHELAVSKVEREVEAVRRLEAIQPGITYHILAYSKEDPGIVTETIPDSFPLSYFLTGLANEHETGLIIDTLNLLHMVHAQGFIVHEDALARNFLFQPSKALEQPDDPFHGVIVIDFEKTEFQENLPANDFVRLQKEDLLRFIFSIYPIIEDDAKREDLITYFQSQKEIVLGTIAKLYGPEFTAQVRQELDQWLHDVIHPE